ncbi:efflux RND transporter periplasmic adaptor subunit [Pseudomonas sp. NFPP19]|uniref:efflux RND transporter periplasmic adaptor subunit n=1 Tax=Pseudomonas sp. NFPP19 TaxID=1566225 RepID=UPI0008B16AF8|nr:efflux RND transporter periplasmic adaptor subunit [Pseudomonas sp. NFPP19]SEP69513.1 membrane fusion protein, multidrug efflux system [Pseudomonas sp. NFPP19]
MNRKLKFSAGAAVALAMLAVACKVLYAPAPSGSDAGYSSRPATKVAVAQVMLGNVPNVLSGIGELEATRQVMVSAETSGLISAIAFAPGDRVRAGQVLVQLNAEPQLGELARLQAQASNAQAQLQRTRTLLPQQAATQEQLDQAHWAYQQVLGDIRRVKALIEQKRIKAPFDGVLGVRKVNLGQYLQAGEPVVSLTDARTLYANITLPERSLAALATGQDMAVAVDAYPQRSFKGRVGTLEPRIDPGTRTVLVQAVVANPDHLLTPGMYVHGQVALPPGPPRMSVPETAVSYSAYGDFVYVVQGTDDSALSVRQAYVKTGERLDGRVVLQEGVQPGDRVVTSGQLRLQNGAPVQIANQDSLALDAPATAARAQ